MKGLHRFADKLLKSGKSKYYTFNFNVIEQYARINKHVKFIQVGSNDGITKDPLHEFIVSQTWEGILVEPVSYLFEKLKANYASGAGRLHFENSAIAAKNGKMNFYHLKESKNPDIPWFYNQIGSFKEDIVLKHRDLIPGFDDLFIKEPVSTIKFCDLVNKYDFQDIDLIQMDTEGYDFEIIKLIPLSELGVEIIMYEHKHLSISDYKKSISLLNEHGFFVGALAVDTLIKDTIAIKPKILNRLLEVI